ncbi:hypothetical protein FNYG_03972 [Fusarium nygamai]|uniref:Uncharacterized protein n=1 Tax=Gibberella nygamai TaxID=42673 RepID=A0A2K0WKG0_GIBNY|nr:hypothetical protein FNYG_03972 [Fusarium nygamai]
MFEDSRGVSTSLPTAQRTKARGELFTRGHEIHDDQLSTYEHALHRLLRRPIKGSIPWPCEPNELRNKSPIEASSMETLTLAARDSDLNNAVRIGVDANMQRFEIHFEENGRKWSHCIGPRSTAMQYLYFDESSAVPDRIIRCYVTMKYNIPRRFTSFQHPRPSDHRWKAWE